MGMVDKTKRALTILQQRSPTQFNGPTLPPGNLNFGSGLNGLAAGSSSSFASYDQQPGGVDPLTRSRFSFYS